MRRLLILLYQGGPAPEQIYTSLGRLGVELVTIYVQPTNPATAKLFEGWVGHFGDAIEVPRKRDIVSAAIEYARTKPFDGAVTFSESLLEQQAAIVEVLGLRGNPPQVVERAQSKLLQRQALAVAGVPSPRFSPIYTAADLDAAAKYVGFPAVLKPAFGAGSYHVYAVHTAEELAHSYQLAIESYTNRLTDAAAVFLLEEKLIGVNWHGDPRMGDYGSVESLILDGKVLHLTVSDRPPLAPPFRETGMILPSELPEERQRQLQQVAENAIRAIGLRWGAAHTEIKYTPAGPAIIEVNGRSGGPIPDMIRRASNYDLVYQMGRIALGWEPETAITFTNCASLFVFAPPPYPVRFKGATGATEVRQRPEIDLLVVPPAEGAVLSPQNGLSNAAAFFYAHTPDRDAALRLQAEVADQLRLAFEPVNGA